MDEQFKLNIEGNILGELVKIRQEYGELLKQVSGLDESVKQGFDAMKDGAKKAQQSMSVLTMDVLGRGVDLLGAPFRKGAESVYSYDKALKELSAITDITGSQLDNLGDMAKDMSVQFGGTPAEHLKSYTRLLSALTPEIAKNPEALNSFGKTVAQLSVTMGDDAVGAVRALETAMNQYAVNLDDPIAASKEAANMANIIAAAAKVGKVEVPGLSDALTRSGAEAAAAGVNFMDLNAALEVAGKFFGSTERLGTAMRGVMTTIGSGVVPKEVAEQMESYGVNMEIVTDKSLSLKQRLTELQKISGDQGLMEKVFGAGETTAGRGLLNNLDLLEKYKTEMTGMPDALQQMSDTMNDTYEKSTEKIKNFFGNIRQSIFEMTGDALPALDVIGSGLSDIIMLAPGIMAMKQAIDAMRESQKLSAFWTNILSSATWKWTAALLANPLTWVVAGIAALVAGVIYAWNHFEGFRAAIYGLWETFKQVFTNIADFFKKMLAPVFEAIDLFKKGDYAGAAAAAAKGAINLVTLPMQAATALVKGEFTKGVGDAYQRGAESGRKSFQDDKKEDEKAVLPGAAANETKPMLPGNNPDVTLKQTQSGSKEQGGGGRIITVHINQLVGTIQNHIAGAQADMTKIREAVKEALVAGVRDFELSGT